MDQKRHKVTSKQNKTKLITFWKLFYTKSGAVYIEMYSLQMCGSSYVTQSNVLKLIKEAYEQHSKWTTSNISTSQDEIITAAKALTEMMHFSPKQPTLMFCSNNFISAIPSDGWRCNYLIWWMRPRAKVPCSAFLLNNWARTFPQRTTVCHVFN